MTKLWSDVTKTFFQDQDQDFKILSRPRRRPSLVFKTKTLHLKTKIHLLWCSMWEKHFSFSAVNENADENEIPYTAENETKSYLDIYFRPKNENESHLIILVFFFHTFSHHNSPTMRRQYLVQFRLFLQMVLVDGIPLSSCTVYYLCGIF